MSMIHKHVVTKMQGFSFIFAMNLAFFRENLFC